MPRALVTGGAGFLGSHLCDRLLAEGYEVVAFDNLLTGSTDNLAHLLDEPRFRFVNYDVTEYLYLDGPIDAVYHMASPASPIDFPTKPIQILKVNGIGTHRALGLARAKGARFLIASTSEVYGDPLIHPQTEEYWGNVNPIGTRGVYDEAKRYGEATGPLRLDAKTGQVRDERPLTGAQAQALLRDRGFSEVREAGREGDAILATAQRGSTRMDVRVDARSGAVSQR